MKKKLIIIAVTIVILCLGLFLYRGMLWIDLVQIQQLKKDEYYSLLFITPSTRDLSVDQINKNLSSLTIERLLELHHPYDEVTIQEEAGRIGVDFHMDEKFIWFYKVRKGKFAFTANFKLSEKERKLISSVYDKHLIENDHENRY